MDWAAGAVEPTWLLNTSGVSLRLSSELLEMFSVTGMVIGLLISVGEVTLIAPKYWPGASVETTLALSPARKPPGLVPWLADTVSHPPPDTVVAATWNWAAAPVVCVITTGRRAGSVAPVCTLKVRLSGLDCSSG